MSKTDFPEPLAYTIEAARDATGLARSRLFVLIASGELEARKAGRRTLIVGDSLRAYVAKLPPARRAA
jgi:hypothetical protein